MRRTLFPGNRYGLLTVISLERHDKHNQEIWRCRCDCGTESIVRAGNLRSGHTKSCGCQGSRQRIGSQNKTHGHFINRKPTRTYKSWSELKLRCLNSDHKQYPDYGGRGITVCERWRDSFENFLGDMGEAPAGTFIERINNNGNYEPGNCKWATRAEQNSNKRNNRYIEMDGALVTFTEAERRLGMAQGSLRWHVRCGRFKEAFKAAV